MSERDIRPVQRFSDSADLGRPPRPATILRVFLYVGGAVLPALAGAMINSYLRLHDHELSITYLRTDLVEKTDSIKLELRREQDLGIEQTKELGQLRGRLDRLCARIRCP